MGTWGTWRHRVGDMGGVGAWGHGGNMSDTSIHGSVGTQRTQEDVGAWGHRVGDIGRCGGHGGVGPWRCGAIEVWGHRGTQKTHGGHGDLGDWGHGGVGGDMGIIVGRGTWGEVRDTGGTRTWGHWEIGLGTFSCSFRFLSRGVSFFPQHHPQLWDCGFEDT